MSCSLRDAVSLEALGIPTVVYANDVFRSIAFGTAELLGLSRGYVEQNVVFFPHPTSNLTRAQVFARIDDAIETVVRSLEGSRDESTAGDVASRVEDGDVGAVRAVLEPLAASLREDGAELTLLALRDGVLHARLDVDEAACADGTCVLPRPNLVALLAASLRTRFGAMQIELDDSRERAVG